MGGPFIASARQQLVAQDHPAARGRRRSLWLSGRRFRLALQASARHRCHMQKTMEYRGYQAEVSEEGELLVGHISGIRDRVGFHAESFEALREAFREAVDDYLEVCQIVGKAPPKPDT